MEDPMSRKNLLFLGVFLIFLACAASAEDQTWTGRISDSMCGAKHGATIHQQEGSNKKTSDEECVKKCVDAGAKYVFVTQGKIFSIDNQDFVDLKASAGRDVKLTGELTGDTIKVSRIEAIAH
jgi:hypothetical protein